MSVLGDNERRAIRDLVFEIGRAGPALPTHLCGVNAEARGAASTHALGMLQAALCDARELLVPPGGSRRRGDYAVPDDVHLDRAVLVLSRAVSPDRRSLTRRWERVLNPVRAIQDSTLS